MAGVASASWQTYKANLKLVVLFSIPFVISFFIPLLVPLPTYISAGAIFLRSASIFTNLTAGSLAVITISLFFSLLFISFAFVAISLIVKSARTHTKIGMRAFKGIEKYTANVFLVLLVYSFVLLLANIVGYYIGYETVLTSLVGFFGFLAIFYAPSAIVVDDRKIGRAIRNSIALVVKEPKYFISWLFLITILVSILDFVFILATGTFWSRYIMLTIVSLLIVPYFVIFQAEAYMKRFPLLKH